MVYMYISCMCNTQAESYKCVAHMQKIALHYRLYLRQWFLYAKNIPQNYMNVRYMYCTCISSHTATDVYTIVDKTRDLG